MLSVYVLSGTTDNRQYLANITDFGAILTW
jgi:hypothetical protein